MNGKGSVKMEEKKLKVADLAAILEIAPKTVYKMIERGELTTVNEKVNNRSTTLVVVSNADILKLKETYCKYTVNNGNYYDNVTLNESEVIDVESQSMVNTNNNNSYKPTVIDQILTLNNGYNDQLNTLTDRIQTLSERLITAEGKQLLLEDKASREGFYLNEINNLKKENSKLNKILHISLILIFVILIILAVAITYFCTIKMAYSV